MSKPEFIDYSKLPGAIMKGKVIPKMYYPTNTPSGNAGQKLFRFEIPAEKGFWDPYSVYIKMTIQPLSGKVPSTPNYFASLPFGFTTSYMDVQSSNLEYLTDTNLSGSYLTNTVAIPTNPNGNNFDAWVRASVPNFNDTALQLNDSFHSLWDRFIIRSGNEIVEDIQHMDIISGWLKDMSNSDESIKGCHHMGMYSTAPFVSNKPSVTVSANSGISGSLYSTLIPGTVLNNSQQQNLALGTGRAQYDAYQSLFFSSSYTLTKASQLGSEFSYKSFTPLSGQRVDYNISGSALNSTIAIITGPSNIDNESAFSQSFSLGGNEFFFTNLTIASIQNGQPLQFMSSQASTSTTSSNPLTSVDIVVPLFSYLFGCMLPADRYKMIPMHGLEGLAFDFIQNPNAFFTSYFGTNPADCFINIVKMEMNVNLIVYDDVSLNNAILTSLFQGKGMTIPSMCWEFLSTFPIQQGQVAGEYKINRKFDSMKQVVFGFLDDSWKNYTCYRKNYRLSHNINKLWLQFGNEYFPSLPFEGNSGTNIGSPDNGEFYYNLVKCFSCKPGCCLVNQANYAIDSRPMYFTTQDIANVAADLKTKLATANVIPSSVLATYLNPYVYKSIDPTLGDLTSLQEGINNMQTTNLQKCFKFCGNSQWCNYWENAVIGKALFAIDLDEDSLCESTISGYNTNATTPWSIKIEQTIASSFPGTSTMYVFALVNVGYQFKGGKIYRTGLN